MHPSRRRKKRPNYGLKTVEVMRGSNGFGFTISGQQPCILSCIVANSPADQAGLRAGDFLISVNGISVSKITHDAVVNLIGNSVGPIKMTIADNYFSDSSEEELECNRVVNRKPKYINKSKARRNLNRSSLVQKQNVNVPMEQEAGPIEYKALVGYLGTIELPKQLLPNSRLRTVCSCIRKLKQEKRAPTAMVMTVLPTCLTLKNSGNQIIAIYPTNRVIYVGTTADKESKYFGVITTTTEKGHNVDSCHIFVVNPKIIDHNIHKPRAENFKIKCTKNPVTGYCMEFPGSALYVVSIIQNMYKLETSEKCYNFGPLVANSPQPSASSNSDSGIGFRDDFGNISDRILVVEFPQHRPFPFQTTNKRPSGIDASNLFLEGLDLPLDDNTYHHQQQQQNIFTKNVDKKHLNNLNNIRACESKKPVSYTNTNNINITPKKNSDSSDDNTQSIDVETYRERAIDCPESPQKFSLKEIATNLDSKSGSCDDISMHSSKSNELSNLLSIFKVPFDVKKIKKQSKMASSDDLYKSNLINDKLSPKVYGYRPNYSCEELNNLENNFDVNDKIGFGSLQDLRGSGGKRKNVLSEQEGIEGSAKSEEICDDQSFVKCNYAEGPSAWSGSFEKLLGDPLGLHMFAEFLKKEISAENIYFWISCERFKNLTSEADRLNEVTRIYRQHLSAGAPEAVNVDAQARQGVEKQLQSIPSNYVTHSHNHTHFYKIQDSVNDDTDNDKQQQTIAADLLAQAQKQIFNLMKFDSYPRFLRSEIYRKCLVGESEKVPVDVRLLLQPATPTKLKKSVSNAEDRRRKSLLPWHRKNRSKSKDRGEIDCTKRNPEDDSLNNVEQDHVHSSGSSLTSLDLAIPPQRGKQNHHDDLTSNVCRTSLCRVLLSNGSTTVVQIKNSETIQQLVTRLLDKRGLQYSSFEVYTDKHLKCVNVEDSSMTLAGCEVTVEQRAVFKLDLPNKKMISIRSKYTKIIIDVLRPSLHKYHYNLDQVVVLNGNNPIDLHQPVTSIDGMKLKVVFKTDFRCDSGQHNSRQPNHKIKLDEITNKVFEGILQEKADSTIYKPEKSERGSVKSEDWGSEHSSTFIGKFLRRDSGIHDKKKKMQMRYKGGVEDVSSEHTKKPLIAKLTSGANKFNVSCSESDELVEGLSRAQRRIEDQRGTEINFELPDFLKNKENDHQPRHSTTQEPTTKFYLGDNSSPSNSDKNKRIPVISSAKNMKLELQSNYENRTVLLPNNYVNDETPINVKNLSPVETEVRRNSVEPPPLPPKPKVVPIKPPNWGQTNGFFMNKEDRKQPQMFLEKASSSFV